jgi:hypothetical protein
VPGAARLTRRLQSAACGTLREGTFEAMGLRDGLVMLALAAAGRSALFRADAPKKR